MSFTVEIKNRQRRLKLNLDGIKKLTAWVLGKEGYRENEVSLLFINDAAIKQLNHQYLGRNYPTDVISFPQYEGKQSKLHPWFLGDVVLSTQKIMAQARTHGQSIENEFCLCLIHGILHLLGYRDHPAQYYRVMKGREKGLLCEWKRLKKVSLIRL